MVMRIKQWGSKFEVFKNIKNKLNKSPSNNYRSDELFGMPLSIVQALNGSGYPFPRFVVDIIEFLKENALDMDGIFRRCGSQKRIQEMREACNFLRCDDPLPEDMKTLNQANDLSDLLKQYLRSIPQKLIPESINEILVSAMSSKFSFFLLFPELKLILFRKHIREVFGNYKICSTTFAR